VRQPELRHGTGDGEMLIMLCQMPFLMPSDGPVRAFDDVRCVSSVGGWETLTEVSNLLPSPNAVLGMRQNSRDVRTATLSII
jgi:hypothetical protein